MDKELKKIIKNMERFAKGTDMTAVSAKEMNIVLEEFKNNYILKNKVELAFKHIEDYFYRLNVPDEDLEFIQEVRKELLKEE